MTERSAVKPNRNMVAFFMMAAWMDVSANAIYAQQAAAEPVGTDRIQVFDYKLEPRENFTTAAFRFWSKASDQPIRGIVVLVPGANGDGRKDLTGPGWMEFATKYRLALVACYLQGSAGGTACGTGRCVALPLVASRIACRATRGPQALIPSGQGIHVPK